MHNAQTSRLPVKDQRSLKSPGKRLTYVYAKLTSSEFEILAVIFQLLAVWANHAHKDQHTHFLLLCVNVVTLQVFFEVHFPWHYERVFHRRRAKVKALDSSTCALCIDLRGCIWYTRFLNNLVTGCNGLRQVLYRFFFQGRN